jgi:hypothetical protein
MTTLLFEEHQSFRQIWLWLLLAILMAIALAGGVVACQRASEGQVVPWVGLGIMLPLGCFSWS